MTPRRDINREIQRQHRYVPPYCPNQHCELHIKNADHGNFFHCHGWKTIKRFPYKTRRYKCTRCDKTFSYTFFKLDYCEKKWGLNQQIFEFNRVGVSKRECGRMLGVSEHLIRGRVEKMARFALLKHAQLIQQLEIEEPIVYDGLENFSYSQYDPNNINHAIGKDSLFTYDFNFAPINRNGRMSPRQKEVKLWLEKSYGKYPPRAIRTSTERIFKRLLKKAGENSLIIYSDNHFQYRRVVERDMRDMPIVHITIPAKIYRNYRNKLFAVNNFDMQIRHNSAAFKRETIAFSKHTVAMVDQCILFMAFKNYMRSKFYKKHKRDPETLKKSPAMEVGVTSKILSFKEFFDERVTEFQVKLHEDWSKFFHRIDPTSRQTITPYAGI